MQEPSFLLPGCVLNSEQARNLFEHAQLHNYAIPAINVSSYHIINAVLETAAALGRPVGIQLYHGGSAFMAGRYLRNDNHEASVSGAVQASHYIHAMAKLYRVPVILQSDHCHKSILPWLEGLLEHSMRFYRINKQPLFTSHMIDFSAMPLRENIDTCKKYLIQLKSLNSLLELEIGATGGEEDGVDNTGLGGNRFYSDPADVAEAVNELRPVSNNFTVAASFGNQHGVQVNKRIQLKPSLLKDIQDHLNNAGLPKALLVFHGGSGCSKSELREAIQYGVVKINFNTDLQWAAWNGIASYYREYEPYLLAQTGNPEGLDKPNKKYYDPVEWLRKMEEAVSSSLKEIFDCCKPE
jgi:fructose-bisphosphate aldolase, class II